MNKVTFWFWLLILTITSVGIFLFGLVLWFKGAWVISLFIWFLWVVTIPIILFLKPLEETDEYNN